MEDRFFTKQAKVPVLRKIFRKSGFYTCGICRSEHTSREQANNCLNQCWYQLRNQYPLILKKDSARGRLYRCQYCFREYKTEDAGLECAERCVDSHEKRHVYEQLTNDLPIDSSPKRKFRLVRLVPQEPTPISERPNNPIPKVAPQPQLSQEELAEELAEVDGPSVDDIAPVPQEIDPVVRKHKGEYKDHWSRDGAKYKCRHCGELYYTKIEVEACFERHFDDDGYEINTG